MKNIQKINGLNVITRKIDVPDAVSLKNLSFQLKNEITDLYLVLATVIDGKPLITVMISENIVKEKKLHAGTIVKELAKEIKGGGGGQPFYATAGGKDIAGIDKVIKKSTSFI
jgi:alanyl-tRNA synthetase